VEATQLRVIPGGQSAPVEIAVEPTGVPPEIPGYAMHEVLGRGGMGEVWRATQQSLGRPVAIKLLPEKLSANPEFIARFQKEATALASLSHPNIVQIIDRGTAGAHYYFVMEYVQGRSLRELMAQGALPEETALPIFYQLCRAIDYAHEQRIVHRDLKPENVLVDDLGNVKVADFGLAGIGDPAQNLTATSVAMGTVNYMAPEQRRDAKNVDGRADLYSLGVILYEMLTGELPVGRFKLPSEKIAGVDPRVDGVVGDALESEPAARPSRASELHDRLLPVMREAGMRHVPTPAPSMKTPAAQIPTTRLSDVAAPASLSFVQRHRSPMIGAVAIAVLGGILLFMRLTGREVHVEHSKGELAIQYQRHPRGELGANGLPLNTEALLPAQSSWSEDGTGVRLAMRFTPAPDRMLPEPIHAHAGSWTLEGGELLARQAGADTPEGILIPRAYVDDRFFVTDEFDASVQMTLAPLGRKTAVRPDAPRFAELAFRMEDLQLSVFADPRKGMQLSWRYPRGDDEVLGSTERDVQLHVADETFVPSGRPFTVRLVLRNDAEGDDTTVEAFLDGRRFARRTLKGLHGQIGKLALGCRDLECHFAKLLVQGARLTANQRARAQKLQSLPGHGEK
jgi:serine/threonine-protein kinase